MTDDAIARQLDDIQTSFKAGLAELRQMVRDEIAQLKSEQIADLRKDKERLSDDQRRIWEAVRSLENDRSHRQGGSQIFQLLLTVMASLGSGGLVAAVMHFAH